MVRLVASGANVHAKTKASRTTPPDAHFLPLAPPSLFWTWGPLTTPFALVVWQHSQGLGGKERPPRALRASNGPSPAARTCRPARPPSKFQGPLFWALKFSPLVFKMFKVKL